MKREIELLIERKKSLEEKLFWITTPGAIAQTEKELKEVNNKINTMKKENK